MRTFKVGEYYNESCGSKDYKVLCVKITKCFATFKDVGGEKTYKINRKSNTVREVCYSNCSMIEA